MKASVIRGLSLGLAVVLVMFLLSWTDVFQAFEHQVLDWGFTLRGPRIPAKDITLVLITDEDRRQRGVRRKYADLVLSYNEVGNEPPVIGFDVILHEETDYDRDLIDYSKSGYVYYVFGEKPPPRQRDPQLAIQEDPQLPNRIKALKTFEWHVDARCRGEPETLDRETLDAPWPNFVVDPPDNDFNRIDESSSSATGIGHAYLGRKKQDRLRKVPLIIKCEGSFFPFLSLQMACGLLRVDQTEVCFGEHIRLLKDEEELRRIPIDDEGFMYVNYVGAFDKFQRQYSLDEMVEQRPGVSDVILIGRKGPPGDSLDTYSTPFGEYPGVGVHANILENILGDGLLHPKGWPNAVMFLVLGLVMGGVEIYRGTRQVPILSVWRWIVLSGVSYTLIAFGLFHARIWIEVALPVFVLLFMMVVYFILQPRAVLHALRHHLKPIPMPPPIPGPNPHTEHVMNPEQFLDKREVLLLTKSLGRFANAISDAEDRRNVLVVAGLDNTFIGNLKLGQPPSAFARSLGAKFKEYSFSYQRPNYHPMVNLFEFLLNSPGDYQLIDDDVTLFETLVGRSNENLKALAVLSAVGRLESPQGTAIGTGTLGRVDELEKLVYHYLPSQSRRYES